MPQALPPLLEGRAPRVLIVEDEALIALDLEMTLHRHGCEVVGPAATVADARRLLELEPLDAAVLDVNLGQEKVFAVADALEARKVPFVFATGYGSDVLPERHRHRPMALKPCRAETLLRLLSEALRAGGA